MGMETVGTSEAQSSQVKYKKPAAGAIIGGVFAGHFTKNTTTLLQRPFALRMINKMHSISNNLTKDEFEQVTKATDEIIKNTGLAKKGVEVVKASLDNKDEIMGLVKNEYSRGIYKILPQFIKKNMTANQAISVSAGENAFFLSKINKVLIPKEGLALSAFHELGHAMNANLSTATKILQKSRYLSMLALPITLIALFKTKKAEGEEPKNKLDKATDFVKNNAGKLTFATLIPTIAEEGLASIRGGKAAKKLLSPELFRKISKANLYGFATYLALAVLSSVGLTLGVKLKDKIAHNEAVKYEKQK